MKAIVHGLLLFWLVGGLSLTGAAPVWAHPASHWTQDVAPTDDALDPDLPLCAPDVYPAPGDCLVLGPAQWLTEMAGRGIVYPFLPVQAYKPDVSYQIAPATYLKVGNDSIPLYASLEAAAARSASQYLKAGRKYLSIVQRVDREDGIYYNLENGLWLEAGEANASCCIRSGRFQGLLFTHNPRNSLGWIVDIGQVRGGPGRDFPKRAELNPETVVQIYDRQQADTTTWYMIGLNQWVERRYIRELQIRPTPPEGVTNGRWIEVNLYEQTLAVYQDGQIQFATLIASGVTPMYTQPGLFQIYEMYEQAPMSGSFEADGSDYYYFQDVPYTMYFDGARALHGAYWRTMYGYPQSHGCVNLSIGDSHWLYDWAELGDWVYVWDPSGETPTDPEYYKGGGP